MSMAPIFTKRELYKRKLLQNKLWKVENMDWIRPKLNLNRRNKRACDKQRAAVTIAMAMMLSGCAIPKPVAIVSEPDLNPAHYGTIVAHAQSQAEPELVTLPKGYHISWPPGDYTNFTVVSSESIAIPVWQWPTYIQTQSTNFPLVVDSPERYFAIYGTNLTTGESAWAGDK